MRDEIVEHFLFDYVDPVRFRNDLKAICVEHDVHSNRNRKESYRAIVVLGDCGRYMQCASREREALLEARKRSASC